MDNIKATSLQCDIRRISLDYWNPRITWKTFNNEDELLEFMYDHYSLDELALSMTQFWYFNAEPLVVIPNDLPDDFSKISSEQLAKNDSYIEFIKNDSTTFTVIEWNRRASTIKILLNIDDIKGNLRIRKEVFLKDLSENIIDDLLNIPIIVYPRRDDIVPYLWVKHIGGSKPWDPYSQALYIAKLIEEEKYTFDEVKNLMSDKSWKVIKNYVSLRLLEKAEDLWIETNQAKQQFSFLTLSIWQLNIKKFLWLPSNLNELEERLDNIIQEEYIENFKKFYLWIFWDKNKPPIITESRDITNYLTKILWNNDSTETLIKTNNIEISYERSDWEKNMVIQWLITSHRKLSSLRDTLEYLLKNESITVEEIEKEIIALNNDINNINNICEKYNAR